MAERVQQLCEEMIPEIECLLGEALLSRSEVKVLIERRTQFEYSLLSGEVRVEDYQRYLQYEHELLQLLDLRRSRVGRTEDDEEVDRGRSLGIRRLHFIYSRAVNRFSGHIPFWISYVEFARETESTRALNSVLARMLQLHPMNASLWVLASNVEFDHNGNIGTARNLLFRAIRTIPRCSLLYIEHFKLELRFLNKLKDRLALVEPSEKPCEPGMLSLAAPVDTEQADNPLDTNLARGAVPLAIFKRALDEFPGDLHVALQFSSVAAELSPQVTEYVSSEIAARFSEFPEYWNSIRSFERGLEVLPCSPEMHQYAIADARSRQDDSAVIRLCIGATKVNCASVGVYHEWIRGLARQREFFEAARVSKEATQQWPMSESLRNAYFQARIRALPNPPSQAEITCLQGEMTDALSLPGTHFIYLKFLLVIPGTSPKQILHVIKCAPSSQREQLVMENWADLAELNEMKALAELSPTMPVLLRCARVTQSIPLKRRLLEEAVERHSYSVDAWLYYMQVESESDPHRMGIVYSRALKTLPDPQQFIEAWTKLSE